MRVDGGLPDLFDRLRGVGQGCSGLDEASKDASRHGSPHLWDVVRILALRGCNAPAASL